MNKPLNTAEKIERRRLQAEMERIARWAVEKYGAPGGGGGPIAIADVTGLQSALDGKASAATLTSHTGNTSNPHSVTQAQVGLGNVPNVDATDPANITQDSTHRFATDAEKATWNAGGGGPDPGCIIVNTGAITATSPYGGYSIRQVVPANVFPRSGSKVRLSIKGPATAALTLDHLSAVPRSGSTADGTTTPVEFLFAGASGLIVGVGQTVYTDWLTYTWTHTADQLLIFDLNAGSTTFLYAGPAGWTAYYKAASASYNQQSVSGYSSWPNNVEIVYTIELMG